MSKRKKKSPEGKKISILRGEGVPEKQAVAEALSMKREGRLTKSGGYIRGRRSKGRKRSRA
jgi:hypothetical protein